MNWLDLVITLCIVIGLIKGLFDGIIKQVISLIGLVLAIFFAGGLATLLQPLLGMAKFIPTYAIYPVCYTSSFIIIILLMALLRRLLEKIWGLTSFGCLNNLAGGVIGMFIASVILSLVFNFLVIFDKNSRLVSEQTRHESVLFEKMRVIVPTIYPYVRNKVREGFEQGEEIKNNPEEAPQKKQEDNGIYEI